MVIHILMIVHGKITTVECYIRSLYRIKIACPLKNDDDDDDLRIQYWLLHLGLREKTISNMKNSKAAGPSGIVVEMLMTSGETGIDLVMELANFIVNDCMVPADSNRGRVMIWNKGILVA